MLLVAGFSMLSVVSVLETMRIANRLAGTAVFAATLRSETGGAVRSSLGLEVPVAGGLDPVGRGAILLVCGGTDVVAAASPRTLAWLRRCASHGAVLGGLCTGSYVLARAGVLRGRRVTIHWDQAESFAETFPEATLSRAPFEVDGPVLSTAGGIAGIDLMLDVLRRAGHARVAGEVAAQLMYVDIQALQARADIGRSARMTVRNRKVARVVMRMEETVEDVQPMAHFAELAGTSVRQLERLFRAHLSDTPKRHYMRLRLDRALRLLLQTDMSLSDVAFATGFQSVGSFGRKFRERYGHPPSKLRG